MPMLFSMIETYDHLHSDGPTTSMCNKIDELIFKNVTAVQNETSDEVPECAEVSCAILKYIPSWL
jgi:hypothetical protein